MKNLLLSLADRRIFWLSPSYEGSVSERQILREDLPELAAGSVVRADLGFLGVELPGVMLILPQRKPRAKPLSAEQKIDNQAKASLRITVEHAINGIKIARIVKDRIRLRRDGIKDLLMEICCGLHNFRLSMKHPTSAIP